MCLQKQLLEDLFIKLCPRVGAEHLALRESLAVLAHAFITMQVGKDMQVYIRIRSLPPGSHCIV